MASEVEVHISDRAIISALNTPGGAVYNWRNEIAREVTLTAINTSPINDVMNAMHRNGIVGEFKRSFAWDASGSNGNRVRATIYNGAPHAIYVEEGRGASNKWQQFSWTKWGGDIRDTIRTGPRSGRHVLRRALVAVMGSQGLGA